MPLRICGIKIEERVRAVQVQDHQPRKFRVPVGRYRERLKLQNGDHVDSRELGGSTSEQNKLVRPTRQPGSPSGVHARNKGRDDGSNAGRQHLELLLCGAAQPDTAEKAVHPQRCPSEQLRQRSGSRALHQLDLRRPVLTLAKTKAEEHIQLVLGLDHRDAVAIAA